MKKIHLLAIMLLFVSSAFAQVKTTVTKSSVTFQIKNLGINTHGSFSGLQASVQFNPSALATSSIEASVDATTVNSDNTMRDDHLKSADYFDVATYPKITVKSVSFKHKSGDNYAGQFNVTIKDKTKLVEIPFTYNESGNTAAFNGSFKINRTDFGIGGNNLILSNEATVTINTEISK